MNTEKEQTNLKGDQNAPNESNEDENDLHSIILRNKFLNLSRRLEDGIFSLVGTHMKQWRRENLPLGNLNAYNYAYEPVNNFKRKTTEKEKIPSRVFVPRNSLLNDLFSISHIISVYNIFAAILVILFLQEVVEEFINTGRIDLGMSYMYWAFNKFDRAIIIWLYMKASTTLLVYLGFHYWSYNRHKYTGAFDVIGATLYIVYMISFLLFPVKNVLESELGIASSVAVLSEQVLITFLIRQTQKIIYFAFELVLTPWVRMLMKTWAFVWSNIGRAKKFKKIDDNSSESPCPEFSHYIYFLFAPTLVYRNDYPRNPVCNWRKVRNDFGHVILCLFYMHFLFARFCGPVFQKFGTEEFSHTKLIKAGFSSCFPGFLILLCGFFMLLHSWMNAFAEMLRFADRMFYKDWWNSTSYPRFYRTWNCVVHDWLYEYVYKEICDFQARRKGILSRFQLLPMLVVFFISAVVHEYIISFSFRFCYPVLLILFGGLGVFFMFINTKDSLFNVFVWVTLILGTGVLMCLYSMEWYARINCDPVLEGLADYFAPRSWFCFQR